MPNYHKLYTPQDSAVVIIDHQLEMLFGVADRLTLINNVARDYHFTIESARILSPSNSLANQ